jgi:hypothetical protein
MTMQSESNYHSHLSARFAIAGGLSFPAAIANLADPVHQTNRNQGESVFFFDLGQYPL